MYGSASCAGKEDGIDVDAALSLVTSMLKVADIEEVMSICFSCLEDMSLALHLHDQPHALGTWCWQDNLANLSRLALV